HYLTASALTRNSMHLKIIISCMFMIACLAMPEPEPNINVQAKITINNQQDELEEEGEDVACGEDNDAECVDPITGTKDCPTDMQPSPGYCSEDQWICCIPTNSTQ
ncbi:unnamed protein product, partial [Meganyctiphanes norvegica]